MLPSLDSFEKRDQTKFVDTSQIERQIDSLICLDNELSKRGHASQ